MLVVVCSAGACAGNSTEPQLCDPSSERRLLTGLAPPPTLQLELSAEGTPGSPAQPIPGPSGCGDSCRLAGTQEPRSGELLRLSLGEGQSDFGHLMASAHVPK